MSKLITIITQVTQAPSLRLFGTGDRLLRYPLLLLLQSSLMLEKGTVVAPRQQLFHSVTCYESVHVYCAELALPSNPTDCLDFITDGILGLLGMHGMDQQDVSGTSEVHAGRALFQ